MKKTGICPKCGSKKIGFLEHVIQRTEASVGSEAVRGHSQAPLGISRTETTGFLKFIKEEPVGKLEAYLCGSCGYYETYVKESGSLPFESLVGFRWVSSG